MSIQITPSNEVEARFPNSNVKKHAAALVFDKWTFVSATFSYVKPTASNLLEVTRNIIVGTNSSTFTSNSVGSSALPGSGPSAVFRIGGSPTFIGEISTINFYNPGGVIPPGKDNPIEKNIYVFFNRILFNSQLSSDVWIRESTTLS